MNVKSPCKNKCELNFSKQYCISCQRTTKEIENWPFFSNEQKRKIIKQLKLR